jgi:hypothetical protein
MPILMVPGRHAPLGFSWLWSPRWGCLTGRYFPAKILKRLFRSETLACPLQRFIATLKEEESATTRRLKNGITAKKAFFPTR